MHTILLSPQAARAALPVASRLVLAVVAGVLMTNCTSTPKSEVIVSVQDQKMGLYSEGQLKKQFVISTSKFGLGDKPGSCCTPLGKHEVIAKIGHGLPPGAVLKSRSWNGEVLKPNAPGRDPIVSRILWLRGMESSNRNAMNRYIYIHGTPEESRLGTPASYGCVRMGMKDVVEVFNDVSIGAKVIVTKGHLPKGKTIEEPKVESEDAPTAPLVAEVKKTEDTAKDAPDKPAAVKKEAAKPKNGKTAENTNSEAAEPIAKGKTKKSVPKTEKITTSKRTVVRVDKAHG